MKKNLLVSAVMAFMAWATLSGCSTGSEKQPELQAPETTQSETPAADAQSTQVAIPADTTSQRGTPADGAKTKKAGKDSNDDDDDDRE